LSHSIKGSRSYFAVLVFPAENDKLIPNLGFIYGVFFMLLNFLASITIGNWVIEGGVVR
jgi:hypothetical protein